MDCRFQIFDCRLKTEQRPTICNASRRPALTLPGFGHLARLPAGSILQSAFCN
jgi:hypothetical protein